MLKRCVLCITGPTGVGKTALSLHLATRTFPAIPALPRHSVEIVSSDSVQMYRELNVGSSKVSVSERNLVPHHLVDAYSLINNTSNETTALAQQQHFEDSMNNNNNDSEDEFNNGNNSADASHFAKLARDKCDEILQASSTLASSAAATTTSKIPIIVGGSCFYISTLLYGNANTEPRNDALRDKLFNELTQLNDWNAAYVNNFVVICVHVEHVHKYHNYN